MLKRLELVGFKSFADKTQFDFTDGITAVVGPNGSGKSNVVDAVRWILGEQSAKSLRGGEMADVIFNGSTTRRSLGLAEVTMTFDNRRRVLATEADEVQITRRVYRDGQGEYLINQQICRLKDIKDLFLGSGAGSDAYCIIEQGKVDVLLQYSTRERRTIFEEAAGISRFKAKKIETLRKLERVDQNVQRLRDIIDEVDKQLRSVKLQAAKAERYQQYSTRLRELRIALGLEEYRQLNDRLGQETAVLDEQKAELARWAAQAETWEADTRRLEEAIVDLDEQAHDQETRLANARQQIAAESKTLEHEQALSAQLEGDLAATRSRMTDLNARVGTLEVAVGQAAAELQSVQEQDHQQRQVVDRLESELVSVVNRLEELQRAKQQDHDQHLEQMRQKSRCENDVNLFKAQVESLTRERHRLLVKSEQAAEHLATLDSDLAQLMRADEELQGRLAAARQSAAEHKQTREQLRQRHDQATQESADLKAQRSGLTSRIEVLEGLERSQEGLGTGVREVLALCRQPEPGAWATLVGMIADLLNVRREYAPLIDLALGERAQHFLVRDANLLERALAERGQPFSGRVSFLPTDIAASGGRQEASGGREPAEESRVEHQPAEEPLNLESLSADDFIRADRLVTCAEPALAGLPEQLLGRTLIVRDLTAARTLAGRTSGYRFLTLRGELLAPDGTVTVGMHHAEAGILSRKSELRELRQQVETLDLRIADCEHQLAELRDRLADLDARTTRVQEEIDVLSEQSADLRTRIGQHRQRRDVLHEEVTLSRTEISALERDIQVQQQALEEAQVQAQQADRLVQELHARIEQGEHEIRAREHERQARQHEATLAKVALGKVEERLASLASAHRRLEADLDSRRKEQRDGEQRLSGARRRLHESQCTMLAASAALARLFLDKEAAERRVTELARERDLQRQERQLLADRAQTARNDWRVRQEQAHERELAVNDVRHRRDSLVDRLREDYQVELAELAAGNQDPGVRDNGEQRGVSPPSGQQSEENGQAQPSKPTDGDPSEPAALPRPTEEVQTEIDELKRKLSRLGSVNLESLQELSELEARSRNLQVQYDDLNSAKRALEEIIQTINQDSRRLFQEAFAAIRTHFQELFRKLFGGGMADIVLEDESDILESGIEIIARPPGKELRSISLLSGGEKTLTAVALLLAIFRSKPSPFCILDEVDAALDEANIGRYTAVLRDFLDRSQFIIITHSKKTMSCADVLYGITMQESGVSKRVSVRFEDWPDDGQPAAASPAAETPAAAAPAAETPAASTTNGR